MKINYNKPFYLIAKYWLGNLQGFIKRLIPFNHRESKCDTISLYQRESSTFTKAI